jgi:hypothetical protein
LHVFQHSNRFEKILHSSSKSASISQASFNSMKDHDLKIYIDWHIQSKSHKQDLAICSESIKRAEVRFADKSDVKECW